MKQLFNLRFIIASLTLVFSLSTVCAQEEEKQEEKMVVFDIVEQMPEFGPYTYETTKWKTINDVNGPRQIAVKDTVKTPGGPASLMAFLSHNIKYPAIAEKNGIQGRVVCTFIVEKDGSITNIRVEKSVDPTLDNEAIRVLRAMPNWIPGRQGGSTVRVKYTVPVTFRLQ